MFKRLLTWLGLKTKEIGVVITPTAKTVAHIVSTIKMLVDSPVLDIATSLIPGVADDAAVKLLRPCVDKVATEILLAEGLLEVATSDPNEALIKLIEYLKTKVPEGRTKFYVEIAGKLNLYLSDGKLSLAESIALGQLVYDEMRSNS